MKTSLPPALSPTGPNGPSAKAGASSGSHPAGADGALGFLAQLAAAIGAIGPLGQAPVTAPGTDPAGTATALPSILAGAATSPLAAAVSQLPARSGPTAAGSQPPNPVASMATSAGIASGGASPLALTPAAPARPLAAPAAALPAGTTAEVTAASQKRSGAHRATPADAPGADTKSTSATDTGAPSTRPEPAGPSAPSAADAAHLTDSAAAGIDPLSAAAASTSSTVTTDDGTQQTTAVLRQVFPEVTRVASTPGTHRLAITLHPDDLGEVRVTVVVRGESVRVNVATDPTNGVARTALEHGAPELRRLLESTGSDARVEFRDLGAGAGLGSTTDGGRQQQPQASGNGWTQSQDDGRSPRQSHPHPESAPPHRPANTNEAGSRPGPQIPTARTAASGLDQLI